MKADTAIVVTPYPLKATESATRSRAVCQRRVSFVTQTLLIASKEFGDRFRSGWVIACVVVWLGAIGLTSFLGLLQIGQIGVQGYERTVISLLNLVQYLVPLLGLLLGHDLIVSENEERTLRLVLAGGVSRSRFLIGKFLGGCLSLAVPLLLGFIIAGVVIGIAAKDAGIAPFLRLAVSGLILGLIFLGMGLTISVLCRTRVQSLVAALLTWCFAVFVFDLIALGLLRLRQGACRHPRNRICVRRHPREFGGEPPFGFRQRHGCASALSANKCVSLSRLAGPQPD